MNRGLGVPGKSATERALQSRQRAERLLQQADQWDRGAHGERAVANLLSGLPAGCRVLHDLSIPGSAANIDHVVVATTGIFVIDTKNYRCTLTAGDGTLWRGRYPIRKECSGVAWQASKIGELVGHPARPVLCFVETKLPEPVQQLGPVIVCTDTALVTTIRTQVCSATAIDVDRVSGKLSRLVRFQGGQPHRSDSVRSESRSLQPTRSPVSKPTSRRARTRGRDLATVLLVVSAIGLAIAAADQRSNDWAPPPMRRVTVAAATSDQTVPTPLRSDPALELAEVTTTTVIPFSLPFLEFHCEAPGKRWLAGFVSNETRTDTTGFQVWLLGTSGQWMYWGTFRPAVTRRWICGSIPAKWCRSGLAATAFLTKKPPSRRPSQYPQTIARPTGSVGT